MLTCKRCNSQHIVKSGKVRGKQRYLCKQCGYHFVEGDERENSNTELLKAVCALLHAIGANEYGTIGEFLNRDQSLIRRWMNENTFESNAEQDCVFSRFTNTKSLYRALDEVISNKSTMLAENIVDGMYIALIIQSRDKK